MAFVIGTMIQNGCRQVAVKDPKKEQFAVVKKKTNMQFAVSAKNDDVWFAVIAIVQIAVNEIF